MRRIRSFPLPTSWWVPLVLVVVLAALVVAGLRAEPDAVARAPRPARVAPASPTASSSTTTEPCTEVLLAWLAVATRDPAGDSDLERARRVRDILPDDLHAAFDRWWDDIRRAPAGGALPASPPIDDWFARTCP